MCQATISTSIKIFITAVLFLFDYERFPWMMNFGMWQDDAGVYLVAEPADRYPGDDNGGVSDFSAERRSISHLRIWGEGGTY